MLRETSLALYGVVQNAQGGRDGGNIIGKRPQESLDIFGKSGADVYPTTLR